MSRRGHKNIYQSHKRRTARRSRALDRLKKKMEEYKSMLLSLGKDPENKKPFYEDKLNKSLDEAVILDRKLSSQYGA